MGSSFPQSGGQAGLLGRPPHSRHRPGGFEGALGGTLTPALPLLRPPPSACAALPPPPETLSPCAQRSALSSPRDSEKICQRDCGITRALTHGLRQGFVRNNGAPEDVGARLAVLISGHKRV